MDSSDASDILERLRRIGGEPETVEVKAAVGGLPLSLRETLSALANSRGGTIMLGVDERRDFAVVGVDDATALQNGLARMARDDLTPPLAFPIEIVDVEGKQIVVAVVPPAPARVRPVYVTAKGIATGSYLRAGDGDRRMTQDEIGLVFAGRTQPRDDMEPVPGTSRADLDVDSLARTLQRVRRNVSSFRTLPETEALYRLLITAENNPGAPLTLAGLLAFGLYPQQFFPQLMVSAVVIGEGPAAVRFVDNSTIRGSIPQMIEDTMAFVERNLAVAAVITERGRQDRWEFPLPAIREAVVNALLHRDYSPITRGTQVQVELTPDAISVRSPGGLFGGVSVDELGVTPITSSRNSALAALLPDTYLPQSPDLVAENRASGIPAMIRLTHEWGLPAPDFADSPASFVVTMERVPSAGITTPTSQCEEVRPAHQENRGPDRTVPLTVLPSTVAIDPRAAVATAPGRDDPVATALQRRGTATAATLAADTGLARPTIATHLRSLLADGRAVAIGALRSPKRVYRWDVPAR